VGASGGRRRPGRGEPVLSDAASAVGATSDLPGPLAAIAARPRLAALLGAMCISFSGIFYSWSQVSPETGTFYRCAFGLPFLAGVAYLERRKFGPLPRTTFRLALIAGIFFAGDLTFWHHAIEFVGAGLATVLGNLQVLVVGLVAWAVLGERPPRSVLVALPIVLVGVVLISGVVGTGAYGSAPAVGVVLGLLTATCYAGYLLIIRRGGRDLRRPAGPVAVATASTAAVAAFVGVAFGTLDLTPGPQSLFWLALLGITSQFLGYLLISLSLPRLPAVVTSIILLAQPVVTVALAIVLLGETPSPWQLAGVGLVIGGIAVATVPAGLARRATTLRASSESG
jgi:drug/metabolite transporter (DMT)-like permease